ncbi:MULTISPECIES: lysozyme inhibitor LprI family protein [Bradyrhizobium]|uniref:lysozyme inhibitor LprI family protein n=1 Tax=Bradyrhizobium TaxID=374 RepID=UPI0012FD6233|nr:MULTISPECIES: lysozyme inhibitor LprI family protein [Bradyrhizobium]MDI2076795.1 lysozyme inhibitor LprI family protein [Bradyrhizobium sp. Mp27]
MPKVEFGELQASYGDLNEGPQICVMRLRQLMLIIQDRDKGELWPLALVNVATCLEWFARSLVKHLIDYSADRINPNAKLLKDLKINYSLIVQARVNHFSIGDIVAMSRNFSSFDEIEGTLNDLTKEAKPSILARAQKSWAVMMSDAFRSGALSRRTIERQLNRLFEKRNELVHGSPRHLAYDDQLEALVSKRELALFIQCAIEYMRHVLSTLAKFIPELNAQTTRDRNLNQSNRLQNSNRAIKELEQAIESRLASDATYLTQFRRAQHAWRTWRNREADFQTTVVWGPAGSGRPAVYMGLETTLSMDRLRSLESYLRELDQQDKVSRTL